MYRKREQGRRFVDWHVGAPDASCRSCRTPRGVWVTVEMELCKKRISLRSWLAAAACCWERRRYNIANMFKINKERAQIQALTNAATDQQKNRFKKGWKGLGTRRHGLVRVYVSKPTLERREKELMTVEGWDAPTTATPLIAPKEPRGGGRLSLLTSRYLGTL